MPGGELSAIKARLLLVLALAFAPADPAAASAWIACYSTSGFAQPYEPDDASGYFNS